jgi:hypothetical protein
MKKIVYWVGLILIGLSIWLAIIGAGMLLYWILAGVLTLLMLRSLVYLIKWVTRKSEDHDTNDRL